MEMQLHQKTQSQRALIAAMNEQENETYDDVDALAETYGVSGTMIRQARKVVGASRGLAEFFEQYRFSLLGVVDFIERGEEICRLASRRVSNHGAELTIDDLFSYHRKRD